MLIEFKCFRFRRSKLSILSEFQTILSDSKRFQVIPNEPIIEPDENRRRLFSSYGTFGVINFTTMTECRQTISILIA